MDFHENHAPVLHHAVPVVLSIAAFLLACCTLQDPWVALITNCFCGLMNYFVWDEDRWYYLLEQNFS